MRASRRTAGVLASVIVMLVPIHPAVAGSGSDPDDVPGDRFDLAWVSVRATEEQNGVRTYVLAVKTYRGFRLRDCGCVFAIMLDGRGDGRADLAVVTRGRTDGPRVVGVARHLRDEFIHTVVVHKSGWRRFRVTIPREWLSPTRAVRFRATARAHGTTDRAPNAGRYRV